MSNKLERKYDLLTAICMVVGIVIGSGVFFKAQTILEKTGGNMPMGILAWLVGGAIMLVLLLTFSFMSQKYEKVNGLVDYAEATMGPKYGYAMGWFTGTIYFPAMTAALVWLSARYTLVFITTANPDFPLLIPASEGGCVVGPECLAIALFYLCAVYGMNTLSPKLAGKFQTTTTVIKLIPLALMAVVGVIYGLSNGILQQNLTTGAVVTDIPDSPLLASICSTAFAYEGWIIATSINAEIKDSKKNLPRALVLGGVIIIAVYLMYYIGVTGGATNQQLIDEGAPVAFVNVFGPVFGNILNLFVAISCLGTTNGLVLGCTRCMYSLAARGEGPDPDTYGQLDTKTNTPNNSAIFALVIIGAWFLYFYLSNLAGTWQGAFVFDSTELPIITVYLMYLPMLVQWMRKAKGESVLRRYIMPSLAICGSLFMIYACAITHKWSCIWYLIVFGVIMTVGILVNRAGKTK